jgi:hypothetical protein
MGLGRSIKKALKQINKIVTRSFTRSTRHPIEGEYCRAVKKCHRLQHEALTKLNVQYREEQRKVASQRIIIGTSAKKNAETFNLQEKERRLKEVFDEMQTDFRALRVALYACMRGEVEIVESLLKNNRGLKARFMALNPLHIAAEYNQIQIVNLLCRRGINIYKKNNEASTALEIAEEKGHKEALEALRLVSKETLAFLRAVETKQGNRENFFRGRV